MPAGSPLSYCLRLLKTRLRTVYELDQAMRKREVSEDQRLAIIQQLCDAHLLDDLRFARSWVVTRDRLSPRGEPVLRRELQQKGIARELADQVLRERREAVNSQDEPQPSEEELARELLTRRARLDANLEPQVRKRRQMAFLQRRGFTYEVIRRILE